MHSIYHFECDLSKRCIICTTNNLEIERSKYFPGNVVNQFKMSGHKEWHFLGMYSTPLSISNLRVDDWRERKRNSEIQTKELLFSCQIPTNVSHNKMAQLWRDWPWLSTQPLNPNSFVILNITCEMEMIIVCSHRTWGIKGRY